MKRQRESERAREMEGREKMTGKEEVPSPFQGHWFHFPINRYSYLVVFLKWIDRLVTELSVTYRCFADVFLLPLRVGL